MRKRRRAVQFKEIVLPVLRIWKVAKRSDERGNIYVVRRVERGDETVHVAKSCGSRVAGRGSRVAS